MHCLTLPQPAVLQACGAAARMLLCCHWECRPQPPREGGRGRWGIRVHVDRAASCLQKAGVDLEGYDVPEQDSSTLFKLLDAFARAKVEAAAREAANTALPRMKDRFNDVRLLQDLAPL